MNALNSDEIRNALEANGDYDLGRGETLRHMLAESFKGKTRWMAIIAAVYIVAFGALMVYAGVMAFLVDSLEELIMYVALFLVAANITAILKLWFWMMMNRNSVLREVKRLELRIVELAARLDKTE